MRHAEREKKKKNWHTHKKKIFLPASFLSSAPAGRTIKKKCCRRLCLKVDAASVSFQRQCSVFPRCTSASERIVMKCIKHIVFCSNSRHPADATGPQSPTADSRLAVIKRPVRQIVGRHGNNLVPSLCEAGEPDGGSVCLGDVMLLAVAASSPSFPVRSNWKPKTRQ